MKNNIEMLKYEIDRLVNEGTEIINNETKPKSKKDEVRIALKSSGNISIKYNAWYSEALPLIKLVIPERYEEFISYFLLSKIRKNIIYSTFRIADYLTKVEEESMSLNFSTFDIQATFINLFSVQVGIVSSCKNRMESKLDNIKGMLQAELFDNSLDSAKHLYKNNFYRAAGMLAGVVLEGHLKTVCQSHLLPLPPKPTISNYNETLRNNGLVEMAQWRHLTLLGDLRNKCSHAKGDEPTSDDVEMLIDGVEKMIKRVY